MITGVEIAAREFMIARLAADSNVDAVTYEVRAGTQGGDLKGDRHTIVCRVRDNPSNLTGNLRDFILAIELESPPETEATHGTMETAIADAWETAGAAAAFDTAVQAALPGYHDGGLYPGDWQPATENNNWAPGYVLSIGIARDGV